MWMWRRLRRNATQRTDRSRRSLKDFSFFEVRSSALSAPWFELTSNAEFEVSYKNAAKPQALRQTSGEIVASVPRLYIWGEENYGEVKAIATDRIAPRIRGPMVTLVCRHWKVVFLLENCHYSKWRYLHFSIFRTKLSRAVVIYRWQCCFVGCISEENRDKTKTDY